MLKRLLATCCFLAIGSCAFAQTGSPKTAAALDAEVFTFFPDQNSGQIIPFNTRQMLLDMIASSLSGQALNLTQSVTGSISGGITVPSNDNPVGVYQLLVPSDNVTRPNSGSNKYANLLLQHAYGGSALVGGRNSLDIESYLTATTSASNNDRNYQAANFEWYANVNDTGTGGSPAGAGFSIGGAAILAGGATNWLNLSFMEANVAVTTGASVSYKSMLQLASLPQDAVQGSVTDCMICFSAQTGAVGWKSAMLLTNANGQEPLATTGCVVCSVGASTITTGFDISSYTVTGNILNATASNGTATINNDGAFVSSSTASGQPQFIITNSFADSNSSDFIFQKNRAAANTTTNDVLGTIIASGYASGAQQLAADIQFQQAAASSGTHIPSKINLFTSTAATLFANSFTFDQNAHVAVGSGTAPTIGTCSTGTIAGGSSDVSGRVSMSSGQTSCSINFGVTYGAAPFCVINGNANATTLVGTSTTQLTGTFSNAVTLMNWVCFGV